MIALPRAFFPSRASALLASGLLLLAVFAPVATAVPRGPTRATVVDTAPASGNAVFVLGRITATYTIVIREAASAADDRTGRLAKAIGKACDFDSTRIDVSRVRWLAPLCAQDAWRCCMLLKSSGYTQYLLLWFDCPPANPF